MTRDIIESWLGETKKDIGLNYKRIEHFGIFAKDENWDQLLSTEITETKNGFRASILGPYYSYWLENGRGPTKNRTPHDPTVREVVYRWIKKYNIQPNDSKFNQKTLAFFISRSIHEHGIKVPGKYNPGGLVSDVITDKRVEELAKRVVLYEVNNMKSDVIKILKANASK